MRRSFLFVSTLIALTLSTFAFSEEMKPAKEDETDVAAPAEAEPAAEPAAPAPADEEEGMVEAAKNSLGLVIDHFNNEAADEEAAPAPAPEEEKAPADEAK